MVGIAQLVSASGCGPEGRGFESHYSPHIENLGGCRAVGVSPSGKAPDFDSGIRWFESSYPCQTRLTSSAGRAPHF